MNKKQCIKIEPENLILVEKEIQQNLAQQKINQDYKAKILDKLKAIGITQEEIKLVLQKDPTTEIDISQDKPTNTICNNCYNQNNCNKDPNECEIELAQDCDAQDCDAQDS